MFILLRIIGMFLAVILAPIISFIVYIAAIIAEQSVIYTDPLAIFAYAAEFIALILLYFTAVPFSGVGIFLVILIFELTRLRSFIIYAALGAGFAWVTLGWTIPLWYPEWPPADYASVAAGIAGGLTYWMFAGRLSGRWDWERNETVPQYKNES